MGKNVIIFLVNLSANFFVRRMRRKKEIKEEASEDCKEKDGGGLNHHPLHVIKALTGWKSCV